MNYMQSYRFLFDSPKWMANLLAATICILVPIVGPLVLIGYGFEIIEALHRRKESRYPDFDTNRLSEYLIRGLWPWLVRFLAGLPVSFILIILYFGVFVGIATAPEKLRVLVLVLLICLFFLAILLLALALGFVLVPLTLRAGLTQEFGQAFSMAFVKDFIKRTWKELLLVQLFLFASGTVLGLAGTCLFFVGVYPATALYLLADYHLLHQLYDLYLERGGTPIPLKPSSAHADDEDLPMVYEEPPSEGIQPPEEK